MGRCHRGRGGADDDRTVGFGTWRDDLGIWGGEEGPVVEGGIVRREGAVFKFEAHCGPRYMGKLAKYIVTSYLRFPSPRNLEKDAKECISKNDSVEMFDTLRDI